MTSFDGNVINVIEVFKGPLTVDAVIVVVQLLFRFYLKVLKSTQLYFLTIVVMFVGTCVK